MVAVTVLMGVLAILAGNYLGQPLRDPEGFLGPAWVRLPMLVLGAFIADIVPRTLWRTRFKPSLWRAEATTLVREHWTRDRIQLVVVGLVCFYITYVSYRNLKNFLPFMRDVKYDYALHELDKALLFGNDPAILLHDLLGSGISAHFLSAVYLLYLPMVPISVAAWLVWSRNISFGYWFATAQCLCWSLGTASYYILPTLGPNFVFPWLYADLDPTGVTDLQDALFYGRTAILGNPFGDGVQSVAGFASLHVAVTLMMALVAQYTVRHAVIRWILWANVVITVIATLYFGWHYIADDIAGAFIAWLSFYLGALATGQKFDRRGRSSHPTTTTDEVPVEQGA
ncbi:hypothetical protein GCM10027425_28680 [Alteromonas gracilis]